MRPHLKHCLGLVFEKALVVSAQTVMPWQPGQAPRYITAIVPVTRAPHVRRNPVTTINLKTAIAHVHLDSPALERTGDETVVSPRATCNGARPGRAAANRSGQEIVSHVVSWFVLWLWTGGCRC